MCLLSVSNVCEPGTAFPSTIGIAELFQFAKRIHVASKGPGKKMMSPTKCKCKCYPIEKVVNWKLIGSEERKKRERDTHTERDRDKDKQRQRETETKGDTQRETKKETDRERQTDKERQTEKETDRERQRETERQRDKEKDREREKKKEMSTLVLHVDESLNDSMMEVKKHWNAIVKLLPNNVMVS